MLPEDHDDHGATSTIKETFANLNPPRNPSQKAAVPKAPRCIDANDPGNASKKTDNAMVISNAYLFSGCTRDLKKKDIITSDLNFTLTIYKKQWQSNASSKDSAVRNDEFNVILPMGAYFKVTRGSSNNKGTFAVFKVDSSSFRLTGNDIDRLFSAVDSLKYIRIKLVPKVDTAFTYPSRFMDLTQDDMMFKGFRPVKIKGFAFGSTVNGTPIIQGSSKVFDKKGVDLSTLKWSGRSSIPADELHDFGVRIQQGVPAKVSPMLTYMHVPKGTQAGNPGFIIQLEKDPGMNPAFKIQVYKKKPKSKEYVYLATFNKVEKGNTLHVKADVQK